jgi:hypothetical protein
MFDVLYNDCFLYKTKTTTIIIQVSYYDFMGGKEKAVGLHSPLLD